MAIDALVLALLVALLVFWLKDEKSTAQEAYRSLASSSFTEELPLGIELDHRDTRRLSGGEELGSVSFFEVRKTQTAEGGIVVVSYRVYRSRQTAISAYEKYWRGLREANDSQKRGYRFFKTEIARSHVCVGDELAVYCQAVVGNVTLQAQSKIHTFKPDEPSHIGAILAAAFKHLDRIAEPG